MKVTWLTQSGLLFENKKLKILVDPYLSDSLAKENPEKARKIPVDESFFDVKPDVILITHDHVGHLDAETLTRFLSSAEKPILVLSGEAAYRKLKSFGGGHNYVMLSPHSVWSEQGITFYSVRAEHTERTAVGFIIDDGKRTFYISGDTLYNYDVIDDVLDLAPDGVDFAFLPISGRNNNMNARDAADFAYEIGAKCAIPTHYDLTNVSVDDFDFDDKIILEPYKETKL